MTSKCPECGVRFTAPRAGVVLPCPKCGNPVAIHAQDEPKRAAQHAPVAAPKPSEGTPQMPWALAAAVVGVLVLAHYALYLLITADARSGIEELRGRHGVGVTQEVKAPGEAPPANTPKYREWHAQDSLYDASRAYADHEAHRSLVATGLGVSVLIQLAITGFALMRMSSRIQREATRRGRSGA